MFDRRLRRWIDPALEAIAFRLHRCGLSANTLTVGGFLAGAAACGAIATEHYAVGLALLLTNRLADGLDGSLARRTQSTDLGGFLDIVLDTIFYAAVPFAFALADGANYPAACFLIFSFVGTGGSFLAYAVISARRGVVTDVSRQKSFFYSVGLMEGGETILFFVLFCLLPGHFAMLAWIFGVLCWLTTALRIVVGCFAFHTSAITDDRSSGDRLKDLNAG